MNARNKLYTSNVETNLTLRTRHQTESCEYKLEELRAENTSLLFIAWFCYHFPNLPSVITTVRRVISLRKHEKDDVLRAG